MRARDILLYLLGNAGAIRKVASSSAALRTGIILVLLTAIARNYDQTFLAENPLLWMFGPLLFSVVSGSLLYAITYRGFACRWMPDDYSSTAPMPSRWRGFMGLFWMTAPIAWLYAIPVERFLDSVEAAWANIVLLGVVSLWRVLLMARVLSVLCKVSPIITLAWVLAAAALEVCVVMFFGMGKRVGSAMGGMRNSPAEDVLLQALSSAFTIGVCVAPVAIVFSFLVKPANRPVPLPETQPGGSVPWKPLAAATAFWILVAILPQVQTHRSAKVEYLVRKEQWRAALDYLSAHQPKDFAPSRVLVPKSFERAIYDELPSLLSEVRDTDAPWVRQHLFRRLNELSQHFGRRRSPETEFAGMAMGFGWMRPEPGPWARALERLHTLPDGRVWLATNSILVHALADYVARAPWERRANNAGPNQEWRQLALQLQELGATNSGLTNLLLVTLPAQTNTSAR